MTDCKACLTENTLFYNPKKDLWECIKCGLVVTSDDVVENCHVIKREWEKK